MHSQRNATWKISNQGGLGKRNLDFYRQWFLCKLMSVMKQESNEQLPATACICGEMPRNKVTFPSCLQSVTPWWMWEYKTSSPCFFIIKCTTSSAAHLQKMHRNSDFLQLFRWWIVRHIYFFSSGNILRGCSSLGHFGLINNAVNSTEHFEGSPRFSSSIKHFYKFHYYALSRLLGAYKWSPLFLQLPLFLLTF